MTHPEAQKKAKQDAVLPPPQEGDEEVQVVAIAVLPKAMPASSSSGAISSTSHVSPRQILGDSLQFVSMVGSASFAPPPASRQSTGSEMLAIEWMPPGEVPSAPSAEVDHAEEEPGDGSVPGAEVRRRISSKRLSPY